MDNVIRQLRDTLAGVRARLGRELQGRHVSATAPADNELLGWNATTKKWEPKADAPTARVYNSGNLTITDQGTGGWQELTFDSERYDTDSIHSTASNTSRLTATTAGKYIISASIRWDANVTGRRVMRFLLNGTTSIAHDEVNPANISERCSLTTQYDLAATDYVEVEVWQSSTANRTITAEANSSPEFMMARLGPRGGASAAVGGDHGTLTGLGDDDHTIYLLATGARAGSTGAAQDFSSTGIKSDVIAESTGAAGVTADGVLLKDSEVTTDVIHEKTPGAGITVDGLLIKDNFMEVEEIPTPTDPALNNLRIFARASGNNIVLIARSSQGAEAVLATLDDTAGAHTNTLGLNWIE